MVILKKVLKMEKVKLFFKMEIDLMVGGLMIKFKAKEHMFL